MLAGTSSMTSHFARAGVLYSDSRTLGPGAPSRPTPSSTATCTLLIRRHVMSAIDDTISCHPAYGQLGLPCAEGCREVCSHRDVCHPLIDLGRGRVGRPCHPAIGMQLCMTLRSLSPCLGMHLRFVDSAIGSVGLLESAYNIKHPVALPQHPV